MFIGNLRGTLPAGAPPSERGTGTYRQSDDVQSLHRASATRDRIKSGGPLPLADAARRLRGRPGRPRKRPERSHVEVTPALQARVAPSPAARPSDRTSSVLPRLLGVEAAGRYLEVSAWTIRDLVAGGQLQPVRLSLASGKAVRRLLFDRMALDLLVDTGSSPRR
jgi:hypothetical protein